jgi:hypothetical protein
MNVEAIAQGLASEHGDERNALRVIVQSHMNLELDYAIMKRRMDELERENAQLKKGVSWGAIYKGHLYRKYLKRMKPPVPEGWALDVADPVTEGSPNG